MLNRMETYGRTDKKPFGNILNVAARAARSSALITGGAMDTKTIPCFNGFDSVSRSVNAFSAVMDNAAVRSAQNIVEKAALGKQLPLCRVTGTDH